ncbi:CU044_5270 family protein [Aeromicrobium alkaliterrae]|uniref:Anti-sigma factor n=1 Tax=Aeromicrobium alkaliterrae TaxID=302168 RepID=A0ABN2JE29_9ACTN
MTTPDDDEQLAEEIRRDLLLHGVTPKDLEPLDGQSRRAREHLARIVGAEQIPSHSPRRTRKLPLLLAAAAVAALIAGTATVVGLSGEQNAAQAAEVPLLAFHSAEPGTLPAYGSSPDDELADLAARARSQPVSAGAVQHIVVDAWYSSSGPDEYDGDLSSELVPVQRDALYSPDGTVQAVERRGPALDKNGRIDTQVDWSSQPITSEDTFPSLDPGPGWADSLPTTAPELASLVESRQDPANCEEARGACLVQDLVDLNTNWVVPPAVTAAFWEVLATSPDISYLGETTDRLGRPALAFTARSAPGSDTQTVILVDPETGLYSGEETILIRRSPAYSFDPPAVLSYSAIVTSERVN